MLQQERDRLQHPRCQELVAIRPAAAKRVWGSAFGCRTNLAHVKQSRPDSDLESQDLVAIRPAAAKRVWGSAFGDCRCRTNLA